MNSYRSNCNLIHLQLEINRLSKNIKFKFVIETRNDKSSLNFISDRLVVKVPSPSCFSIEKFDSFGERRFSGRHSRFR